MVTNHIHEEILKEEPRRTGLYMWPRIFGSEVTLFKRDIDFEKYDVIHVNLAGVDVPIPDIIREKIGWSTSTKIVINMDYAVELWQSPYEHPLLFEKSIRSGDKYFSTEPMTCMMLERIVKKKVYEIPHPCDVDSLKKIKEDPEDNISIMYHTYDNQVYAPYFTLRDLGKKLRLLGYLPKADKLSMYTKQLYDKIVTVKPFPLFVREMKKTSVLYEPYTIHSYGRATVDAAALGIPVVGSNRVASVNKLFPKTAVNPINSRQVYETVKRVLEDEKFRQEVVDYAYQKVDEYNLKNSEERFLRMLEEP